MSNVFIIDDELQIAQMLAEVVEMAGFVPTIYTDARKFLEEQSYDNDSVILLDLNMPTLDGVEVIRELAKHQCRSPLILMSGYDMSVLHSAEKLAYAHELEIISSFTKPIQLNRLMETLIDHKQLLRSSNNKSGSLVFEPTRDEIYHGIINDQMVLYYQPQIEVSTGAIVGAECLVRWDHPQHGLLAPFVFIERAEQFGLMDELTNKVIEMALDELTDLKRKHHEIPLSVNVSADSIRSIDLPEKLSALLQQRDLSSNLIQLEITESVLMGELVTSLDILTRLRMKNFALSIDDFGTGFSSLSLLHKIPFTELKVDKSFVMEMDKDRDARAIVKTCIILAKELNMRVVAEGVESANSLAKLQEMGCDIAQGFHIAKPMPREAFEQWIADYTEKLSVV